MAMDGLPKSCRLGSIPPVTSEKRVEQGVECELHESEREYASRVAVILPILKDC